MNIKRFSLVLTLLSTFAWAPGLLAQDEEKAPKIDVTNPIYDFGDIDRGKEVTTKFKFKNTGNAPLEILDVATSCGCTSAVPEKKVYAANESGEIPVTFDSGRFNGPITKRVTIRTNDPTSPETVVTINGNVVVEINAKPTSLFFARAKLGEKTTQELIVSTEKLAKLEIKDVAADQDFLSVTEERIDDQNIKIIVTADGKQFPDGRPRLNGTISYKTNSDTQPEMKHIVAVSVERPIRVTPSSVYFFASKAGKERETFMRLKSTGEDGFTINDIKSSLDFIKIKVEEDANKEKALLVTLLEDAPEGKFQGKLTLSTSLPNQPEVVIPIRGSVVQ